MKHAVRLACVLFLAAFAGCGGGGGQSERGSTEQATGGEHGTSPAPAPGGTTAGGAAGGSRATLMGKVNLVGTPPERTTLKMTADPVCAQQHTDMPALSQEVIANDAGMLKNVFVYVKNGLEGQSFDTPQEPVTIDQKGCTYSPHVFGMVVNQPLKILNSDPTLHNIHALPQVAGNKEFNLGMPRQGMELTKTFEKSEVMVKVKCDVHPWMACYIGVLEHHYFAVSDDNGGFQIAGLPPGQYTIEAWHEKYGTQTQSITVGETPTVEVNFTFQAAGS